jgi:Golgi phosphoprotein 3
LQRLIQRDIVKEVGQSPCQYQIIDDAEEREVRARLRRLILTDEIPAPRDAVLLSLIDACGLVALILSIGEIDGQRQRIAKLTRLDLLGQAMTKAVNEIRSTSQYTTAPIISSET